MRRAKKRNRPLWWKLMRGIVRATACFVLVYIGLFAWLFFTHPSPSVDYVAPLNQIARSAPPEECGWPIYRPAFMTANLSELRCHSWMAPGGHR